MATLPGASAREASVLPENEYRTICAKCRRAGLRMSCCKDQSAGWLESFNHDFSDERPSGSTVGPSKMGRLLTEFTHFVNKLVDDLWKCDCVIAFDHVESGAIVLPDITKLSEGGKVYSDTNLARMIQAATGPLLRVRRVMDLLLDWGAGTQLTGNQLAGYVHGEKRGVAKILSLVVRYLSPMEGDEPLRTLRTLEGEAQRVAREQYSSDLGLMTASGDRVLRALVQTLGDRRESYRIRTAVPDELWEEADTFSIPRRSVLALAVARAGHSTDVYTGLPKGESGDVQAQFVSRFTREELEGCVPYMGRFGGTVLNVTADGAPLEITSVRGVAGMLFEERDWARGHTSGSELVRVAWDPIYPVEDDTVSLRAVEGLGGGGHELVSAYGQLRKLHNSTGDVGQMFVACAWRAALAAREPREAQVLSMVMSPKWVASAVRLAKSRMEFQRMLAERVAGASQIGRRETTVPRMASSWARKVLQVVREEKGGMMVADPRSGWVPTLVDVGPAIDRQQLRTGVDEQHESQLPRASL